MVDFIENTPTYKRWWLPDRRHQFVSWICGDVVRVSVVRALDGSTVLSHYIQLGEPQWQDLHDTAVELANKRFKDDRIRKDRK